MEALCQVCKCDGYENLTKDKENPEESLFFLESGGVLAICKEHKHLLKHYDNNSNQDDE